MKKYIIITVLISISLLACDNPKNQEAEMALDNLEDWMEHAEDNVDGMTISSWQKIEAEYMAAKAIVDSTQGNLSEDSREDFVELQEEYVELKMKYKAAIDNTQIEAKNKILEMEEWMAANQKAWENNTGKPASEIEEEWNEFRTDFTNGLDNLTEETKEKWNTLENRVNQWIEYELKQNLK